MSYPIRYRFRDRETEEIVKQKKETDFFGRKTGAFSNEIMLFSNGNPCKYSSDFYQFLDPISCGIYLLEVALEKDEKGNWIYKQVGY